MTISNEAVEAAAKAAYEVMPVELFGEDGPVLWEHLSDSILGNSRKHHELDRARAALEVAAPFIRAEALEKLATDLEWVKPEAACEGAESCCGSAASCDLMQPSAYAVGSDWLRARAAEMRVTKNA